MWNNSRIRLKFEGRCYKQEWKATFTLNNIVNLFTIYELDTWSRDLSTDFTLKDFLLGSVKLTKNADPDKYKDPHRLQHSVQNFHHLMAACVKMSLFLELT